MATSAASAAGSDSNRAAYARDLESIGDGNRLRIDESTLSAFDLLLELPIFENQVPSVKADSINETVVQQEGDDASRTEDEDTSRDEQDHPNNLPSLPITPRIQETLNQEPKRLASEDRKMDAERVPAGETQHDKDSQGKPAFEMNRDSSSHQPIDTENSDRRVDPLLNDVQDVRNIETGKLADVNAPTPEPLVNRGTYQQTEPSHRDSHNINQSSQALNEKTSKIRVPNDTAQTNSLNRTPVTQAIKDSKLPKKTNQRNFDTESAKPSTNAPLVVNRRAERLAETKRGESPGIASQNSEQELSESHSSQGRIEITSELTLTNEPIDPVSTLDGFQALSSELTETGATVSEATSTQPSVASSIVSSGVVAAASAITSASTSVAGLEGPPNNSVGGAQGTTPLATSPASRTTTPWSGRASTLSAYQEHRVLQRVLKGLEQLDHGGGSVRLRLHPPELGSLQITLRVEAQQVSALVEVEQTTARDVLLSNLPQLQSRLSEQGLNVSQFDVQVVDPNQWSQGSGQGWEAGNGQGTNQNDSESQRSSRYLERLRNQIDRVPSTESSSASQVLWTRKNGQLDVRV